MQQGKPLENPNPVVYEVKELVIDRENRNEDEADEFDSLEIFDLIRKINDPEHPLTLEQLNVTQRENILVDDKNNHIRVQFTPTIPHCSMATLIGLSIRVKLLRSLPSRFKVLDSIDRMTFIQSNKVDIQVTPGTHASEAAVNKQLNDKERVAAALENGQLLDVVNKCIAGTD